MEKVANNLLKNVSSGELVQLKSLWANRSIVLSFVRRWGWKLCRALASELSSIKPLLDANGIGLVAVGLEELGVKAFVDGQYFKGDLYIDQDYSTYKGLSLGRVGLLSVPSQILASSTKNLNAKANALGISGDLKGDGLQLGGTFVVERGGKVLFEHKMTGFADHPSIEELLRALNIKSDVENLTLKSSGKITCNEDACQLKS